MKKILFCMLGIMLIASSVKAEFGQCRFLNCVGAAGGSNWTDTGLFLEPLEDGDGVQFNESGGTNNLKISQSITNALFSLSSNLFYEFRNTSTAVLQLRNNFTLLSDESVTGRLEGFGNDGNAIRKDVYGSMQIIMEDFDDPGGVIDGSVNEGGSIKWVLGLDTVGGVAFTDTERMRLTGQGNLGIGTSTPTAMLDVKEGSIFNSIGGDFDLRVEGLTDPNLFFIDASTDRVGIGTNSPRLTGLEVTKPGSGGVNIVVSAEVGGAFVIEDQTAVTDQGVLQMLIGGEQFVFRGLIDGFLGSTFEFFKLPARWE